ncbi:MAG TPA: hypothetical protein ENJ82_06165 [Bacteroidetes bacterium]|nr:hypothetical protein [Bacteroidota bacterium]
MSWKEQLSEIEKEFGFHKEIDWQPSIDFVNELLTEYPNDVELNVRAVYFLHNILVEEEYPDEEESGMVELFQKWFSTSKEKFSNNAEYLFFIGKILHISEWFFGLEDTHLALDFQKKAMEKEPENQLYEWAYRLSLGDDTRGNLAHQLIESEKAKIGWLEKKGFPGEYILEHLRMSHEEYLEKQALQ